MSTLFSSLDKNNFCDANNCLVCPLAKQTRLPFSLSKISSKSPFEMLHIDIWGAYHIASISRARDFLTIVDDFTRCTWVYLMNHKSETQTYLTNFISMVETQFSSKIKVVRSDNCPEFTMKTYYLSKCIIHQTSCIHTPKTK